MRRFRFPGRRHLVIGLLAVVFALGTLAWVFTFPYHPSRVLRVVPPEATVVSWHLKPTGHMEAVLRSAPAAVLLAAGEVSAAEAEAAVADPGVQALLERLAGTGVALAFAPAYGTERSPSLFLGSWVGGVTTHLARYGWLDKSFEGFTVYHIGRDRVWSGSFPELPAGMQKVSFAVYEGVLAGCASSDPFAAFPLLLALKRHGPLTPLAVPLAAYTEGIGHFRARQVDDAGNAALWAGAFDVQADGRLTGRVMLEETHGSPPWFAGSADAQSTAGLRAVCPLPADLPAAIVALPLAHALATGEELLEPGSRERVMLDVLAGMATREGGLCAWVSGGDYSGRLMRLKVPSIGFAFQVDAATPVDMAATRLVDTLNSLYGTGLIAVPDRTHSGIRILQPVKDKGGLAFLGADERPALAIIDGWLVGMSNVAVLRRVLSAGEPSFEAGFMSAGLAPVWLYGHARLPVLGDLTGNALAGYAFIRLLQTGKAERLDTPVIKRVLAGMEGLGGCTLQAGLDPQGCFALVFDIDGMQEGVDE